jgi:asparagine synthase (glutamine-hydrolysing)
MSAIGGIIGLNGASINVDQLLKLGKGLSTYGPDGGMDVRRRSVAMVHRAFHTNRESRNEKQPLVDTAGHVLAWDGRLDNRRELLRLLSDEVGDENTDAAIVLGAFKKWGIDFPQRLIGDFALSLWDPKSQTLFLARDPVGARLLFYHVNDERVVWSTRLEPLLSLRDIELEIDDEYIAGYFTTQLNPSQTPYKNVFAVPPAHLAVVSAGQVRLRRFWGLDPNKEIRYRTDAEYEDHFRELFREAVRVRLRADGPVWADLSGGLDSSSVVCVADNLIENGDAECTRLDTVSAVFDESPTSDERKFITKVEEKRGRQGHHFQESEYRLLTTLNSQEFKACPNLLESWSEYHKGVRQKMRASGARVLLTGIGGDELLTSSADPSVETVDLLVQGKLLDLHQRLKAWSLALKKPYLAVLWRHTLTPAFPKRLRLLNKRADLAQLFLLLDRSFVRRFNMPARVFGAPDPFGFRLPSARGQATAFLSVMKVISSGALLDWDTIEITYPFTHRPLVEFLQAIPPTQWVRPGETRSIMRRSLGQYLPEAIVKRRSKGTPAEATLRAVRREWSRLCLLLRDSRIVARGYVDEKALASVIDQPFVGYDLNALSLVRLAHLECWIRSLEIYSMAGRKSFAFFSVSRESGLTLAANLRERRKAS